MAKARMIHTEISRSLQVNDLTLEAQLLFTWTIPHADDEGRIRGEARYIKGTVVPIKDWTTEFVEERLNEIQRAGLIYRWEHKGTQCIEFIKWKEHQKISPSKFKPSLLPPHPFRESSDTEQTQSSVEADQYNSIESNPIEVNKRESNTMVKTEFAGTNTQESESGNTPRTINPKYYNPNSREEYAALEAWKKLEPSNPMAFKTTYLKAVRLGLPADHFFTFASEIAQDPAVENNGKVFNDKVRSYFETHSGV